ncbi:hypothetical protein [Pseudomonas sp. KNUC1026]|uniref:hypothetical protein n=1 Tax=Pseudomonas sp. KNUC1026 TaxID=2893890 RepID=UPI001F4580BC|nr:hypothetical protein [Pseudomonas sp. KNUC1026]UFH50370.1 hypothetical protein LN139_03615 [Pseudomonas sp. KNUC1026]
MNDYDARHLRLLDIIKTRRWSDLKLEDIEEIRVLIACKYLVLDEHHGRAPTVAFNPDGRHYHRSLRLLAEGYARQSGSSPERNCSLAQ